MKTRKLQIAGPLYVGFFGYGCGPHDKGMMEGMVALYGSSRGIHFRVWRFVVAWRRSSEADSWSYYFPSGWFVQKEQS